VIAFGEHPRVHRSVWFVAGRATFAHGFVFEDERTALGDVALAARLLLCGESRAATDDCLALVRIVTI